jgi:endonuclease/exonuclease/phosphatase family metal-dependent hydrolase
MKIATWNLERPNKSTYKNQSIIDCLTKIDADILILTETNEIINLGNTYNYFHTSKLEEPYYKEGERRVSIYTKYNSIEVINTFRDDTSICIKLETPIGDLAVYGTVIGIHGNRRESFVADLNEQLIDFTRIAKSNNFCICGDLNMTFSDNYYYTKEGRQKLNTSFEVLNLINLTANIPENIDHIVLTKTFIGDRLTKIETWNLDKKFSDHIGVAVEIF